MKVCFFTLLSSLGLVFTAHADDQAAIAASVPMVQSYAVQPVHKFNEQLAEATAEKARWADSPESISKQYVGNGFELVSAQQRNGSVITYNVRPSSDQHPQLLLILSLNKHKYGWRVNKAGLSWRCQNDAFYGTNNCQMRNQSAASN